MKIYALLLPELIVVATAFVLFVLGGSKSASTRRLAPVLALAALLLAAGAAVWGAAAWDGNAARVDSHGTFKVTGVTDVLRVLACGISTLFVLLAWPSDREGTSNRSISFGGETSEFFALLLLSVAGVMVVSGANHLGTLFLGIELASIPTYVMVTMSRPTAVAQEAGIKYFFLGAAAAAVMLFGMSYLYGTTGLTNLDQLQAHFQLSDARLPLPKLQLLAAVLMIVGFSFKLAAAPLHFYAGDVYQGAATPVTALLSFVPKTTAVVALVKMLAVFGGAAWVVPPEIAKMLWWLAVLTMTVGNVLGLLQLNVKRVLAYSSVAHSGYLLMGLTVVAMSPEKAARDAGVAAVLFYLVAYGIMNTAAFGVLMLLPSRGNAPSTTAETYDDIAGSARTQPLLGLAMAVSCFSLIGLPLTAGFFGKLYLIRSALMVAPTPAGGGVGFDAHAWLVVLVVVTMVNAAISAAYYLKIVSTMWARADAGPLLDGTLRVSDKSRPASVAVALSVTGMIVLGVVLPVTDLLTTHLTETVKSNGVLVSAARNGTDEILPRSETTPEEPDRAAPAPLPTRKRMSE